MPETVQYVILGTMGLAVLFAVALAFKSVFGSWPESGNQAATNTNKRGDLSDDTGNDPWQVIPLVRSFKQATRKEWPKPDTEPKVTEIDPEEALRLALQYRFRMATAFLIFGAVLFIGAIVLVASVGRPAKGKSTSLTGTNSLSNGTTTLNSNTLPAGGKSNHSANIHEGERTNHN